jgi:hypothetical protein
LYFTIYSIFEVIVHNKLKGEWWSKFVANIWLWVKCDGRSLTVILSHWRTVLIDGYSELFGDFSSFLSQFSLIFGDSNRYLKACSEPDVCDCKSLFLLFLARLAHVKFTVGDLDLLFRYLAHCDVDGDIVMFLALIRSLRSRILQVCPAIAPFHLQVLHLFVPSENLEICMQSILLIHDLAIDRLLDEVLFIAYQLPQRQRCEEVFKRIVPVIGQFPNLYFLLVLLAIPLGHEYHDQLTPPSSSIDIRENWFAGPITILFLIENDIRVKIMTFVIEVALFNWRSDLEHIFGLIYLLQATLLAPSFDCFSSFVEILDGYIDSLNEELLRVIFMEIAATMFFHPTTRSHSMMLVAEFNQSDFATEPFYPNASRTIRQSIESIRHLAAFFCRSFDQLEISYELRFPDWKAVAEAPVSKTLLKIGERLHDPVIDQILELIRGKQTDTFLTLIEQMKAQFAEKFQNFMKTFVGDVRRRFEKVRERFEHLSTVRCVSFDHRPEGKPAISEVRNAELKRDDRLSVFYSSVKLCSKQLFKIRQDVHIQPRHAFNCFLVSFGKAKRVSLVLGEQAVAICRDEQVRLLEIAAIFPRHSRDGHPQLEILARDGRVRLFDFPYDSQQTVLGQLEPFRALVEVSGGEAECKNWVSREMTTFQCLLYLNMLSGRLCSNWALYPVFPGH